MAKKINTILKNLIENFSNKKNELEEKVEQIIKKETKNNKITIEKIEKESVFIKTNNPAWKMEIFMIQKELKKKLTNNLISK